MVPALVYSCFYLCLGSCAPYYQPRVEEKSYFLFGVLCGMALYNHNIVHLPFPLALFKKMVGVKPSLEDLREFDPVVGGYVLYFRMYILALNWYPLEMD